MESVNAMIAELTGANELYKGVDLDWSMKNAVGLQNNLFSFGIKALFFPDSKGEVDPAVPTPAMPTKDAKAPSKVQLFASDNMLDSLASTVFATQDVSKYGQWVNHTMIPAGHPLQMDTTTIGLFFP